MYLIYISTLILILFFTKKTKLREATYYIFIAMSFISSVFLFKDFQGLANIETKNIYFSVGLLMTFGFYSLVNKAEKTISANLWELILPLLLVIINNDAFHTILICFIMSVSSIRLIGRSITIKYTHCVLLICLLLNYLKIENGVVEYLFVTLIILYSIEKMKNVEYLLLFSTFSMINYSNIPLKIITFILLILTVMRFYLLGSHYMKITNFIDTFSFLTWVKIKSNIIIKELVLRESLIENHPTRKVFYKNYSGLRYNIEFFLLLILFVFMVIL